MGSKGEKDRVKQIQERCQSILVQLLKDEDNKYCVDCDAKGPRWASWNLGIFLCIRCAGIHRNLGVHISKVKSVNLDTWTPEQVVSLQQMGNSRARAVYEANLPDSFRRPQNDSTLETFIRAKYEHKKYIAKEWVPQPVPKVNWDKEIDEEMERQKKKKKSTGSSLPTAPVATEKKYPKSDTIPQPLPKPKSSVSPKLGRTPPSLTDTRPSNGAADLLGLNTAAPEAKTQEDVFSNFLSAPEKKEVAPAELKNDLQTEEQNFFNQAAPTEKEKSKMTKDSILALYSQSPNNLSQFSAGSTGLNLHQYKQTDYAAFLPAKQTDYSSFLPAKQTDYSSFLPAKQTDYSSFLPAKQTDYAAFLPAKQTDYSSFLPAKQTDYAAFLPAKQTDYSSFLPAQNGQFHQTQPSQSFNNFIPSQSQINQSQSHFNQPQSQFNSQPQFSQSQTHFIPSFSQAQSNQFSQFAQLSQTTPAQSQSFAQFGTFQNSQFSSEQPALSQQLGNLNLGQNEFSNIAGNGWQ